MTLRGRLGLALVAGAATFGVLGVGPSGAASSVASGWWTSVPGAPAPLDTTAKPAQPGPGQLGVSATPRGATSVAAVRFTLEAGELPISLALAVVSGAGQESAVVVACPVARAWSPSAGGPASDAPPAACTPNQSVGKLGEGTLSFTVSPAFLTGDQLDLVIVPGSIDTGGQKVTPAFNLVLAAPTVGALATTRSQTSPDPAAPFEPTTTSSTAASVDDDPRLTDAPVGTTAPIFETVPTQEAFLEPGPTQAAPPLLVVPAPGVALGPTRRTAEQADDGAAARRFALILFPIAFVGGIWALNATTPALHGIGRLGRPAPAPTAGEPSPGGLARFRRERTDPPVPLR